VLRKEARKPRKSREQVNVERKLVEVKLFLWQLFLWHMRAGRMFFFMAPLLTAERDLLGLGCALRPAGPWTYGPSLPTDVPKQTTKTR
jgi:hypothetical protein